MSQTVTAIDLETAWTKAQAALALLAEQPTVINNEAAIAATVDVMNIVETKLLLASPRTKLNHRTLPPSRQAR